MRMDLKKWPKLILTLYDLVSRISLIKNKEVAQKTTTKTHWDWDKMAANLQTFQAQFLPWKSFYHVDVIKWKHFPRYWTFVRGIHWSPVNSPHKGQWRGALMFSLICVWINGRVNNREAGDLRRYRANYDVIVMLWLKFHWNLYPRIQFVQSV